MYFCVQRCECLCVCVCVCVCVYIDIYIHMPGDGIKWGPTQHFQVGCDNVY